MIVKWNQGMERMNWLFYALMRVLIPGAVVLHFFGFPYGGFVIAFSMIAVTFADRRRKARSSLELGFWLMGLLVFSLWQFHFQVTWQWMLVIGYGLWIVNQKQMQAYMVPGAFGKSFGLSLGLIALAVTATPVVGWHETADFLRWSLPVFLLSAMLMMVRINLMIVYRQRNSHQMNQEKNLLFFNGISMIFFVVAGLFLFSAWLPPAWTAGIMQGVGRLVQWILYPFAVVLAKGTEMMKRLILLVNPDRAGQESSGNLISGNAAGLETREALVPFIEWAGWILLVIIVMILLIIVLRKRKESISVHELAPLEEEKSFMRLDEIFRRKGQKIVSEERIQEEEISRYRSLFAKWMDELRMRGLQLKPTMTPNQIGREAECLDASKEDTQRLVDTYNRVRYRGDDATEEEENRLENIVRSLEENQNFQ